MTLKREIILAAVAGEIASWFFVLIALNPLTPELQKIGQLGFYIWFLPVIFPAIFVLGIIIARILSKISGVFLQLVRYGQIGVLNTGIDFGFLNLLMWLTLTTSGPLLIPMNIIAFSAAVINSYFWNKWWTFEKEGGAKGGEFGAFVLVSLIGIGINTSIVFLGTSLFEAPFNLSGGAWVNLIKILATSVSLIWNFLGYKFIVFKNAAGSL